MFLFSSVIRVFLFPVIFSSCLLPPVDTGPRYLEEKEFSELSAVTEAKSLLQSGRLDSAEMLYRNVLRSNPNSLVSQNDLGYLLLLENRLEEAQEILQNVIETEPKFIPSRLNLARIYVEKDLIGLAIDQYNEIERIIDSNTDTGLSEIIGEKLPPNYLANIYRKKSSAYYLEGDFGEAICYSDLAMKLNPLLLEMDLHARLLYSLENNAAGVATVQNLIFTNENELPNNIVFDFALGLISINDFERAKPVLDRVLEKGNMLPREMVAARILRYAVITNDTESLVYKENFKENNLLDCEMTNFDVDGYWPYNSLRLIQETKSDLCSL